MFHVSMCVRWMLLLCAGSVIAGCGAAPDPSFGAEGEENVDSVEQELSGFGTGHVSIDFDHTPKGALIADRTAVDAVYSSVGVTFSAAGCSRCGPASAYARQLQVTSSNNGVSVLQTGSSAFDAYLGAVEARFWPPADRVSIDALASNSPETTTTARPFIEAYDAQGNLIAKTVGTKIYPNWETLTVTGSVARVRFSSQAGNPRMFANFDNLAVDFPPAR